MENHPNEQSMKRCYEALGAGDVAVLEEAAAPGFSFTVSGTSAVSGTANSVQEAAQEFQRSMELTEGTMEMTPRHLLADDHVGIVVLDVTASRPDCRTIRQGIIHEWRFDGGEVAEIREWIWDQAADVEFWA